jgi:hypothetical protein
VGLFGRRAGILFESRAAFFTCVAACGPADLNWRLRSIRSRFFNESEAVK